MKTWTSFEYATSGEFNANTIATLRQRSNAKISASFGGWNLDLPFRPGAQPENRAAFAAKISGFVEQFQLDGADIDWEFPVDGGQTYHLDADNPHSRRTNPDDATNFVALMEELRRVLPETKTLSIAVPARHVDMVAYNYPDIVSGLDATVDYWKLMTYDFMNRRDNVSTYHAGLPVVDDSFDIYSTQKHIDPKKIVVGFPMYAKWFYASSTCMTSPPLNCNMGMEYEFPNGTDTGYSGTAVWNTGLNTNFSPHTELNTAVGQSFARLKDYDNDAGASAWFDAEESLFWTWVSSADITKTCEAYRDKVRGMGVWSLNQDSATFPHLSAIADCLKG
ncbi:glycoside hydrolase superfamily [Kockovaella imperatae]|uniref:Glycoside hydrolase superfamily n=1 Tax=Kockovaella imperatae TaxID=4999 RepID=A0A1Y1UCH4_9TREE|nr:glycoside hydrolase superfamily [Kockovaella imperatae]ORX34775.1 glycoside hydrolase superfamily [Kockovaella imperatae]